MEVLRQGRRVRRSRGLVRGDRMFAGLLSTGAMIPILTESRSVSMVRDPSVTALGSVQPRERALALLGLG
eukprot:scaffold119473_cov36-Phaeocystis_antarctica.AAC.2